MTVRKWDFIQFIDFTCNGLKQRISPCRVSGDTALRVIFGDALIIAEYGTLVRGTEFVITVVK